MLKKYLVPVVTLMVLATVMVMATTAEVAFAQDVPRMEADQLLEQIDSPDVLIIDVRRGGDWKGSGKMIKNSVRKPFDDVESWVDTLPQGKTIVLYCA